MDINLYDLRSSESSLSSVSFLLSFLSRSLFLSSIILLSGLSPSRCCRKALRRWETGGGVLDGVPLCTIVNACQTDRIQVVNSKGTEYINSPTRDLSLFFCSPFLFFSFLFFWLSRNHFGRGTEKEVTVVYTVCSPVRIGLPVDNATLGPCYVSLAREWDNKSHLSFKSLEALRDTSVHPFLVSPIIWFSATSFWLHLQQRLANVDTNYVLILLVEWIFHDEVRTISVSVVDHLTSTILDS